MFKYLTFVKQTFVEKLDNSTPDTKKPRVQLFETCSKSQKHRIMDPILKSIVDAAQERKMGTIDMFDELFERWCYSYNFGNDREAFKQFKSNQERKTWTPLEALGVLHDRNMSKHDFQSQRKDINDAAGQNAMPSWEKVSEEHLKCQPPSDEAWYFDDDAGKKS